MRKAKGSGAYEKVCTIIETLKYVTPKNGNFVPLPLKQIDQYCSFVIAK